MGIHSLLIVRGFVLIFSLGALYQLWNSSHLLKKVLAWAAFQASIIALWISSSYPYHDHFNPLPLAAAFLIGIFSLGILGMMFVFAMGVLRRDDSLEVEKTEHESAA